MSIRSRVIVGGLFVAVAGFAMLSWRSADAAVAVPFVTIDYPASALPPGVTGVVATNVWGVNELGDLVGSYGDTNGLFHGWVYRHGKFSTVDGPTGAGGDIAVFTQIRSINDFGDIAGMFIPYSAVAAQTPGGGFRALYQKNGGQLGVYTTQGHLNTIFNRISDSGTVYGCYHDDGTDTGPQDSMYGIVGQISDWPNVQVIQDAVASFGTPGSTMNVGGNPFGTRFAGVFYDHNAGPALTPDDVPGRHRAYIIEQNQLAGGESQMVRTNFDVPGSNNTSAWDMDIVGNVVGIWGLQQDTDTGLYHGFLRQNNGNFLDIEVPGSIDTEPLGINNSGTIVGSYIDSSKRMHGFVTWSWYLGANPNLIVPQTPVMASLLPFPSMSLFHRPSQGSAFSAKQEGFSVARVGTVKYIPKDKPLQPGGGMAGMACCHRHPKTSPKMDMVVAALRR